LQGIDKPILDTNNINTYQWLSMISILTNGYQ